MAADTPVCSECVLLLFSRVRGILGHLHIQNLISQAGTRPARRWQPALLACSRVPALISVLCYRGRRTCCIAKCCWENGVVSLVLCAESCGVKLVAKRKFNCGTSIVSTLQAESNKQHELSFWLCFVLEFVLWYLSLAFKLGLSVS